MDELENGDCLNVDRAAGLEALANLHQECGVYDLGNAIDDQEVADTGEAVTAQLTSANCETVAYLTCIEIFRILHENGVDPDLAVDRVQRFEKKLKEFLEKELLGKELLGEAQESSLSL